MRFFSQRFIFCLLTGFIAFIMGCSNLSGDAEKLVGAWELNKGIATVRITFSEDFTFSIQMASVFGSGTATGEWRIEGDQLIILTKTNSLDQKKVDKEEISRILKIDGISLVLQKQKKNGKWGKPDTFKRVR